MAALTNSPTVPHGISLLPVELLDMIFTSTSDRAPSSFKLGFYADLESQIVPEHRQKGAQKRVCKQWFAVPDKASCLDILTIEQLETVLDSHRRNVLRHLRIFLVIEHDVLVVGSAGIKAHIARLEAGTRQLLTSLQGQKLESLEIDIQFFAELHDEYKEDVMENGENAIDLCEAAVAASARSTLGLICQTLGGSLQDLRVSIVSCDREEKPLCDIYMSVLL